MKKYIYNVGRWFVRLAVFVKKINKDHPGRWLFGKSLIFGLPPAMVGYWALTLNLPSLPYTKEIAEAVAKWEYLPLMLTAMPVVGTPLEGGVLAWAEKYSRIGKGGDKKDLYFVIAESVDEVVGKKLRRIGGKIKSNPAYTSDAIVNEVFDPQGQIQHLCSALWTAISTFIEGNIEVVVSKMEDNCPTEWLACKPSKNYPDDVLLKNPKTLFAFAANKKHKPITLGDISKHLKATSQKPKDRQYFPLDEEEPSVDQGSVVCYPIFCTHLNKVVACVSIKSDQPYAIKDDFDKRYGAILNAVMLRIELELVHLHLKEVANAVGA